MEPKALSALSEILTAKSWRDIGYFKTAMFHMKFALSDINRIKDEAHRARCKSAWFSANNKLRAQLKKAN